MCVCNVIYLNSLGQRQEERQNEKEYEYEYEYEYDMKNTNYLPMIKYLLSCTYALCIGDIFMMHDVIPSPYLACLGRQ